MCQRHRQVRMHRSFMWIAADCVHRIQAQFDHLAETYFDGFETDLAERELGYVAAFDHDLDMFAASISLTRTSVAALIKEDGMDR